jgi:pantothenate kinase
MGQPDLDRLAARAVSLVPAGGRAVVGITGPPGAGKSTLVAELVGVLARRLGPDAVAQVPMDGFHLADAQLDRLGLRDRKGAPETFDAAGYAATLRRVADDDGEPVYVPGFERTLEQPLAAALVVPPTARLVLTEGNYLLLDTGAWPLARACMAEVWYCDLDDAVRRERLVARHVQFGKPPAEAAAWVDRSDEANARLVARTRPGADLVVTRG